MPNRDVQLVRGLSITVIVLSALALAGCLLLFLALGVGGAMLSDPSSFATVYNDPAFMEEATSTIDADTAVALTAIGLGFAVIGVIWLTICHAIVLVAGIIGLRASTRPQKLGVAFGWTIAGAVLSLLCGNLITMALLIVAAVHFNKLRTPTMPTPPYQQQPPMAPMPPYQS